MLKPLTPIPSMRRGFRLYPDDPDPLGLSHLLSRVRDAFPCGVRQRTSRRDGHAPPQIGSRRWRRVFRKAARLPQPTTLADRWARRRHRGAGHSQHRAPSRFCGHVIGRSSWSAPAADPGVGLNQYAQVVARARGEGIDVGIGVRVADRHDVELPRVGQRANEGLVTDKIQQRKHLNQPRAGEVERVCGPGRSALTTFTRCRMMSLSIAPADEPAVEHGAQRRTADRLALGGLHGDLLEPLARIGDPEEPG